MAGIRRLDVAFLPPPEPLARVLEALESLGEGETLEVVIHREPFPLYGILEAAGWEHETTALPEGLYRVAIRRAARAP